MQLMSYGVNLLHENRLGVSGLVPKVGGATPTGGAEPLQEGRRARIEMTIFWESCGSISA